VPDTAALCAQYCIYYSQKYRTDMYGPPSEWLIKIIDRDTDPYRFWQPTKLINMPTLLAKATKSLRDRAAARLAVVARRVGPYWDQPPAGRRGVLRSGA